MVLMMVRAAQLRYGRVSLAVRQIAARCYVLDFALMKLTVPQIAARWPQHLVAAA